MVTSGPASFSNNLANLSTQELVAEVRCGSPFAVSFQFYLNITVPGVYRILLSSNGPTIAEVNIVGFVPITIVRDESFADVTFNVGYVSFTVNLVAPDGDDNPSLQLSVMGPDSSIVTGDGKIKSLLSCPPGSPTLAPAANPTAAPVTPTAAPSITQTAASGKPTATPGTPTAAPDAPTAAPGTPTAAPGSPTAAPGTPTAAPGTPTNPTDVPIIVPAVIPTATPMPASICVSKMPGLKITIYCSVPAGTMLPISRRPNSGSVVEAKETQIDYAAWNLNQLASDTSNGQCTTGYALTLFGYIQPTKSGIYTFNLLASGSTTVMLFDGKEVVRLPTQSGNSATHRLYC